MDNYSQNAEQKAIIEYFGEHKGTFIDIGANDGVTFSNTWALSQLGWCGVLVEPSPKAFAKLKANYSILKDRKKGCFYFYNYAIADSNGKFTLSESGPLVNKGDVALVSTIIEKEKDRFKSVVSYEPVTIEGFTWKTFLNRLSIKNFDFISIDAEGCDEVILKQMDMSEVKCVCVEWNSKEELRKTFVDYLQGFNVIYTSAENLIFAR